MAKIYIESSPAINSLGIALPGALHLYLVLELTNGLEAIIRGGPSDSTLVGGGTIITIDGAGIEGTVDGKNRIPSERNQTEILSGTDEELLAIWNTMTQVSAQISQALIPYDSAGPNSNSTIEKVLHSIGIDVLNFIPINTYLIQYPGLQGNILTPQDARIETPLTLTGSSENDILQGGIYTDYISGLDGSDTLLGGEGNDTLKASGDFGDVDFLFGEDGNDTFEIDADDVVSGGDGIDSAYIMTSLEETDTTTITDFTDSSVEFINGSAGKDRIHDFSDTEVVISSGGGNDEVLVGHAGSRINGSSGNDTITSGNGVDILRGGSGNDTLNAGGGNDTLDGGSDENVLLGGAGDDTFELTSKFGHDYIDGGSGTNDLVNIRSGSSGRISGLTGVERIEGGSRGSVLRLSSTSTYTAPTLDLGDLINNPMATGIIRYMSESEDGTIDGGIDVDVIAGIGTLNGNGGNDIIFGASSDASIRGGQGNDTILGSGDFYYDLGDGSDTVRMKDNSTIHIGAGIDPLSIYYEYQNWQNDVGHIRDLIMTMPDGGVLIVEDHSSKNIVFEQNLNISLGDALYQQQISGGDFTPIPIRESNIGSGTNTYRAPSEHGEVTSGSSGHDTLISGLYDDTLQGGFGNDTYEYALGSGHDIIEDIGGTDTLKFGLGIGPSDLTFTQEGDGLKILVQDSGSILIRNWYTEVDKPINTFTFDGFSGTVYDANDIPLLMRTVFDNEGDQSLVGDDQDNEVNIVGGEGNTASGGLGSDNYNFSADAVAQVTITEEFELGSFNTVNFASSTATELKAYRSGFDLVVETDDGLQRAVVAGAFTIGYFDPDNPQLAMASFTLGGQTITAAEALEMAQTLEGSTEADSIQGFTNQNNIINGLDGNDYLVGNINDDEINGGDGADIIAGEDGDDTLDGGADDDRIDGGAGNDTLFGGAGNDRLAGQDGDDVLYGEAGDDILIADGLGTDTLDGGDGNDTFVIESAISDGSFEGGLGQDILVFTRHFGTLSLDLTNNTFSTNGGASYATIGGIEDVYVGTDGAAASVNLIGDNIANIISLQGTVDTVDGGGGADQISTGDFDDTILVRGSETLIDGGAGFDTISVASLAGGSLNLNDSVYLNIENLRGNAGDDTLTADDNDNTVWGGEGNDTIYGNGGVDWLQGEDGDDTLYGGDGDDTLDGGAGNDIIHTGAGQDTVFTGDGTNTVHAEGGDNLIFTGTGADTIYATGTDNVRDSGGIDTLYVDDANGFTGYLEGIENAIGGDGDDNLYAREGAALNYDGGLGNDSIRGDSLNDFADTLRGGEGDDTISGYGGDDILHGDEGDDTLRGGEGMDTLYGGTGADYMEGNSGDDTLYGGDGDDRLYGNEGNDTLYGGLGNDQLDGGAGNDTLEDLEGNNFSVRGGDGDDTILTGHGNDYVYGDAGNDIITDLGGFNIIDGGDGDDSITSGDDGSQLRGGAGHDVITAGAGNDTITGGEGNDAINFGAGSNNVNFNIGDGVDSIAYGDKQQGDINKLFLADANLIDVTTSIVNGQLEVIVGSSGDKVLISANAAGDDFAIDEIHLFDGTIIQTADLLGGGSSTITGTEGDDFIVGTTGDDVIEGLGGNDYLVGGDGADTLIGGTGNDSFEADGLDTIDGGDGFDTLFVTDANGATLDLTNSSIEVAYGSEGNDTLTFGDDAGIFINGNGGDDTLIAGAADNDINGGAGADSIYAGAGSDTIRGGTGCDFLAGQAGSDTYIYEAGDGQDFISDVNASGSGDFNWLMFGAGITEADTTFAQENDNLVITFANNPSDKITVLNWFLGVDGNGDDHKSITQFTFDNGAGTTLTTADIDALFGGSSSTITGTEGDDLLVGTTGDDVIEGLGGNDYLVGGDGADALIGGTGNDSFEADGLDTIDGGDGFDTLFVTDANGATLDLTNSSIEVAYGSEGNDTLTFGDDGGILINGNGGDDTLIAGAADNDINGGAGADSIYAGAGNDTIRNILDGSFDTLDGGDGNDTIILDVGTSMETGIFVDLQNGFLSGIITGEFDAISNIENVEGTSADEYVRTNAQDNFIFTHGGNDFIYASTGFDIYDGGDGNDGVSYASLTNDLNIDLTQGLASGFQVSHIVQNIERATGGQGNDTITGTDGSNLLVGGLGNDSLYGGLGSDTYVYNVGDGADTIQDIENTSTSDTNTIQLGAGILEADTTFEQVGDDLVLKFANNPTNSITLQNWFLATDSNGDFFNSIDQITFDGGNGATLNYSNIEGRIVYESQNITGTEGDDEITTGAGDDIINTLEGADTIYAGAGNDYISSNQGEDIIYAGDGDDEIYGGKDDDFIDGGEGNNTINDGLGNDTIITYSGDDHISDNGGDDTIDAGDGNNTVNAGDGNNTVTTGSGMDTIITGTGNDTVTSGAGDDHITTGEGTDTIYAGDGNDYISSNQGADIIYAGDGDDEIYGGKDDDFIDGGEGNNTINGGLGNDTIITYAGDDVISDNGGDGIIDAGDGNNTVNAGDGNNDVTTGSGEDTIITGSGNDTITSGAGDDHITTGEGADTIYAGDGNDYISSNQGADIIYAGDGDDVIYAGKDDDHIYGGAGNDYTAGGLGNDTFYFGRGDGQDTVAENGGVSDVLNFLSNIDHDQLWFMQQGNDLSIQVVGTTDSVTIDNWYSSNDNKVELINASDGYTLNSTDVDLLVQAMAAFNPPSGSETELDSAILDQLNPTLASTWQQSAA